MLVLFYSWRTTFLRRVEQMFDVYGSKR